MPQHQTRKKRKESVVSQKMSSRRIQIPSPSLMVAGRATTPRSPALTTLMHGLISSQS